MRSTCLFFSLLLAVSAFCQPQPLNRRAMVLSGLASTGSSDIPSTIGLTISNRWMSASFATNQTGISDWVDVTNGFHWTQSVSADQPTNSALGVFFKGSPVFLNSSNIVRDTTLVMFWIYQETGDPALLNLQPLVGKTSSSDIVGLFPKGGGPTWAVQLGADADFGFQQRNVQQTLILNGNVTTSVYTNGVTAPKISGINNLLDVGATSYVGRDNTGSSFSYFHGYLREFIIYTNTSITSLQVSNLQYYADHYPY